MHLAILGTGTVGRTLGSAWLAAGHSVALGSRTADNEAASAWVAGAADLGPTASHRPSASHGTFADVVDGADVVVNATGGMVTLEVLASCPPGALAGRPLLDAANPLDFSAGFPPRLAVCNDDSLAEQVQRAHPDARVVKALNTMAAEVMVAPGSVPGDHLVPIAGDDADAKAVVTGLLGDLGWQPSQVLDLGALDAARGMEMWLPLWLRLYAHHGHPMFNLALPVSADPVRRS